MTVFGYYRAREGKYAGQQILSVYPDAVIFYEGSRGDEQLMRMLEEAMHGDMIVMPSVTSYSTSVKKIMEFYTDNLKQGISLEFLKEPFLSTSVLQSSGIHTDDFVRVIEKQIGLSLKKKRTLSVPMKKDGYNVRKEILVKEMIIQHSRDFNGTLRDTELLKLCNCTRKTYYKYKKDLKNRL